MENIKTLKEIKENCWNEGFMPLKVKFSFFDTTGFQYEAEDDLASCRIRISGKNLRLWDEMEIGALINSGDITRFELKYELRGEVENDWGYKENKDKESISDISKEIDNLNLKNHLSPDERDLLFGYTIAWLRDMMKR